jgi:hypothetical protein
MQQIILQSLPLNITQGERMVGVILRGRRGEET